MIFEFFESINNFSSCWSLVGVSEVFKTGLNWGVTSSRSEISASRGGGFNSSEKCSFHRSF